jgi:hypothetical protein
MHWHLWLKLSTSDCDLLKLVKKDLQMMFSNLQMNSGHCIKFAVVEPSLWIHLLFLYSLTVLFQTSLLSFSTREASVLMQH